VLLFNSTHVESSFGTTDYGLDDRMIRVRFPEETGIFSLHHCVQTDSGAHPGSYPMGTDTLSLGLKRPRREADHSPPSSAQVKECVNLCLHSLNTSSWSVAWWSAWTTYFTFTFYMYHRDRKSYFWSLKTTEVMQVTLWLVSKRVCHMNHPNIHTKMAA
jgi:hypothetical protein